MMKKRNTELKGQDNKQRGAALVIAIFSILLMTIVAFALVSSGLVSNNITTNSREQTVAYYVSEAGLQHAINLVNAAGINEYTNILRAGDGVPNTGDELSTQPSSRTPIPQAGLALVDGYYVVYVSDDPGDSDGDPTADSNGKLVIRSVGFGPNGATATTEAIVYSSIINRIGMLADGDINVTNNLYVRGPNGSIHSNTVFDTNNPVCVDQQVSHSSGASMNLAKISSGTTCSIPGTVGTNVFYSRPKITPEIHDLANIQSVYRPQADFIFKADGSIWRQGAAVAMTAMERTAAGLAPWSWTSGSKQWTYSNATAISTGTYYFEGSNMKVTNGGGAITPPLVTFISEGSILINNGPAFQPKLAGVAMISANDIAVHSALGVVNNPGFVYAYGQIQITNTTTIYGWIEAANFRRADGTNGPDANDPGGQNLVPYSSFGAIRISGVTNIYTPNPSGGTSNISVISRREVRN
jgi:hypothetical protein